MQLKFRLSIQHGLLSWDNVKISLGTFFLCWYLPNNILKLMKADLSSLN